MRRGHEFDFVISLGNSGHQCLGVDEQFDVLGNLWRKHLALLDRKRVSLSASCRPNFIDRASILRKKGTGLF
jgi:hypothetical protein